jgi:TPP-dependent pyruvate/acetoin dehydrogenase alpha subunit
MRLSFAILLLASHLSAATKTVCASGCDYTTTLAAGSGTYTFNMSGSGLRYSASASMSSPTTAIGGQVPVATGAVVYVDHGAGTPVSAIVAK